MDASYEIRKLTPKDVTELVRILETGNAWKELMAIIPKTLKKDDYKTDTSPLKYTSEHFMLIENASHKHKNKSCTEILFDEWGTSGRVRPALGHLLDLLQKAKLYRAVDYVAVNLLNQPPPPRPNNGPQARVTLDINDDKLQEFEKILDQINYPSSAIENILQSSKKTDLNYLENYNEKPFIIPQIIVSETNDRDRDRAARQVFNGPIVRNQETSSENNPSDLIKFSTSQQEQSANIPMLSDLLSSKEQEDVVTEEDGNIPNLSILEKSASTDSESIIESCNEPNLPALSLLINQDSEEQSRSQIIPDVSFLMGSSVSNVSSNPKTTSSNRPCASPLPNLSLNTLLPHFTYADLENATKNFDETSVEKGGRYLGRGAFANVYLALGLIDKQVAIKKLIIDVETVDVDDEISKQFKTEVEVLSKYKHQNLLPLLGYSCDGCTYCLLYEYMPGGTLEERLKKSNDKLMWTVRLHIAIGTARAISYLHTALSTPLIHRDIKSANILLDSNNNPKLSDFGLIKLLSSNQNKLSETGTFGTSAYMPPEAFTGDISVKLDTFSFGVVVLELLTSLPPVDEDRGDDVDLVSHVKALCDNEISALLDQSVGSWQINNVNVANEMFIIAQQCLIEYDKERPNMVQVKTLLEKLTERCL